MKEKLPAEVAIEQSQQFRGQIQRLIDMIGSISLKLNDTLDEYYYIQKETEMSLLEEKLAESLERVEWLKHKLEQTHGEVFRKWSDDMKLLTGLKAERPNSKNENHLNEGKSLL